MQQSNRMRNLWREALAVGVIFTLWRVMLLGIEAIAPLLWPSREGFLGVTTPWANFDGAHYTSIAKDGYGVYQFAFFPFYPWLIHWFSFFLKLPYEHTAVFLSHVAFLIGLFLFWRYLEGSRGRIWTIAFLLLYPASFFFAAAYSESVFFALAAGVLLAIKRKHWILAGSLVALASTTRLVGIFLVFPLVFAMRRGWLVFAIAPVGLLGYMAYLWKAVGDPLAFFHVQPAFGAGRSGSELILLPQVAWRYARILTTVPMHEMLFHVALLELGAFVLGLVLLVLAWRRRFDAGLLLYGACVLLIPTLTGTLSSMPRYVLAAFPLFAALGGIRLVWIKALLLVVFASILVWAATVFLRGYFIS